MPVKKFVIITHVPHGKEGEKYFAYSPYVREMDIWNRYAQEVIVVAPLVLKKRTNIELDYEHTIDFREVSSFNFTSFSATLRSVFLMPVLLFTVFRAMRQANHIHLRCPGNMGLIGCFVQIFFPRKAKTAKYAGNWDPKAKQPWSYRLQKRILSNTFLTRNMQVLVYGKWDGSTHNIKPFFTASYRESDKLPVTPRKLEGVISFVFVGTLSPGKRPLYAVQMMENLLARGLKVSLSLYGLGAEKENLTQYIAENRLEDAVFLMGNQTAATVQEAYRQSHFLILPSRSEGWPKVVAEAMFWGCMPVATDVSCLSYMLDGGNRGLLLTMDIAADIDRIAAIISDPESYSEKVQQGISWSRQYTLDLFETEIKTLLHS